MYLKSRVKIPDVHGKLTRLRRGDITYIKYEYDCYYDPEKKYTYPQRATIGKVCPDDDTMMIPNEAFLKYFPDAVLSGMEDRTERSSCLRVGTYAVMHKIVLDYSLDKLLGQFFSERDMALLLDLASYSIVEESNVAQHYPDYAYNHPLYSSGMKIYSDASVSDFFKSITKDKSTGFLNEWNAKRNRRERIYISYDSTNKNCQAGEIELAEFGHAKTDIGSAIINYSVGYDLKNKEPLFYEAYPGSINDVSQLRTMLGKITGYGYKKIGFILDRGYFSRGNIRYLDECGYSFVIMAKGMSSFISDLILENKGTFENKRSCDMNAYGVYGKTVQRTLFEGDEKKRYIHIYHSISKDADEREHFENALRERTALLMSHQNETLVPLAGESYVGELFKKKKKKAETEEVKPPVKKKKDKYEVLMKSSGIVTAKGDFLTIHKVGQKIYLEYPLKYIGRDILVGGTLSATSEPLALNVGYKYKVIIYYFTVH